MNNKTSKSQKPRQVAPQVAVRANLRAGGDIETCQFNLNKWRDRYYYWYNIAKQQGKV